MRVAAAKQDSHKAVMAKLRKLNLLTQQLRDGEHFQITRLLTVKSFCEDPTAARHFVLHLAERVRSKAKKRYQPLIVNAVRRLKQYLVNSRKEANEGLWDSLRELENSQNETIGSRWGRIRIVRCGEALVAEYALRCVLRPSESAHWSYHAARQYAERSDTRYATGLIPESASAVEDIVGFWTRYYLGRRKKITR